MPNDTFEFKKFKIKQDKCAMKVGTDAVLLGAWVVPNGSRSILDIGTGSGCIAITLKKNLPHASVSALEVSEQALVTAEKNAASNKAPIHFIHQDILAADTELPEVNVIVSNPPYVLNSEKAVMNENVLAHEPSLALFVDDQDPLVFYKAITENAMNKLLPGGILYFEINERYGNETAELLSKAGFTEVKIIKDLYDKDRIVRGEKTR